MTMPVQQRKPPRRPRRKSRMRTVIPILVTALLGGCTRPASVPPPDHRLQGEPATSSLYREIATQDSLMFAAYNRHDAKALMTFFADDLEFYHDKDGKLGFGEVQKGFTSLLSRGDGIRRVLVPGTMRVFPAGTFGAMQLGAHRFCHMENGREDCGTFEFTTIWRREGSSWKVSRLASYGH
jgi:ketosteroid isomerase-like protein